MNEKLDDQIINFMNNVGWYLQMEYHPKYHKEMFNPKTISSLYDFVGSYYMGGNTVPDTARYVIEFIERFIWSANK